MLRNDSVRNKGNSTYAVNGSVPVKDHLAAIAFLHYVKSLLEFIDMEHTPKNILIRAVKRNQKADQKESVRRQQIEASIRKCEAELRVSPTLGRLLDNQGKTE